MSCWGRGPVGGLAWVVGAGFLVLECLVLNHSLSSISSCRGVVGAGGVGGGGFLAVCPLVVGWRGRGCLRAWGLVWGWVGGGKGSTRESLVRNHSVSGGSALCGAAGVGGVAVRAMVTAVVVRAAATAEGEVVVVAAEGVAAVAVLLAVAGRSGV